MKKHSLTEKQKKVVTIVVSTVQILVVLFAIIIAAIVLANPNVASSTVGNAKTKLLPVLTDSMAGTNKDSFNPGDLIIAETPADKNNLQVGQIITYRMAIGGVDELNTHRIVRREMQGDKVVYFTKGDNRAEEDRGYLFADEVLAVYKFHIKGVGGAINWLQQPTNFLLVIILPLVILFLYNIIMFVRMLLIAKYSKQVAGVVSSEEEIKRRAIEEFIAEQKAAAQATIDSGSGDSSTQEGAEPSVGDSDPSVGEDSPTDPNLGTGAVVGEEPSATSAKPAKAKKASGTKARE